LHDDPSTPEADRVGSFACLPQSGSGDSIGRPISLLRPLVRS